MFPFVKRHIGTVVTIAVLLLAWTGPDFLTRLENTFLDFQFKVRGIRPVSQKVVLVVIDDRSLEELGRWPWSRTQQSKLLSAISKGQPKVIGIDILYSEPESPSADEQLLHSLSEMDNVVLPVALMVPNTPGKRGSVPSVAQGIDYLHRSEFRRIKQAKTGEVLEPFQATDAITPLLPFMKHAHAMGHVYSIPDPDGVTRYDYMVLRFGDGYYPSLALEVARTFLDLPRDEMSLTLGVGVQLGDIHIPLDQKARLIINYAGPEGSIQQISAADVIQNRIPPDMFKGKAVLIGTTALATYDQLATPFSANVPGVEKNAMVVENIIRQNFIQKNLWSGPLEILTILFVGLGLAYALNMIGAIAGTFLAVGIFLLYAGTTVYLFTAHGMWVPILTPFLTIVMVFIGHTVVNYIDKEKQARDIRAMFSSYVSPSIVDELIRHPEKLALGGQRKELTMLFADIVQFTALSEQHSAEEVVTQLNEYLGAMTEVVFQFHGTLDKFVGDEIVVFWGAPLPQPNHAELAVQCAVHMCQRLHDLQAKWREEGRVVLNHGIGINSGSALVGNIGAPGKKMDYTMIGDHVNLAARLEKATREFDCQVVVSNNTVLGISAQETIAFDKTTIPMPRKPLRFRSLGQIRVKGKEKPIEVHTIDSQRTDDTLKEGTEATSIAVIQPTHL